MIVRKFVVNDMQEGLSLIRNEMGQDALILSQRPVHRHGHFSWLRKKCIEVYAAAEEENNSMIKQKGTETEAEILKKWHVKLLEADVYHTVADSLIEQMATLCQRYEVSPQQIIGDLIHEHIDIGQEAHNGLQLSEHQQTRVMMTGPSGVGKTSAIIKLAKSLICGSDLKVGIISADYQRAGAHLQIEKYTSILNIPLFCMQSLLDVQAALEHLVECDLIFIDTPGCSPAFEDQVKLMRQLVDIFSPDQLYICICAGTSYPTVNRILNLYHYLIDYRLIITKVDEIATYGSLLNVAFLAKRPINYLTDGPNVSGHIHVADANIISSKVLR